MSDAPEGRRVRDYPIEEEWPDLEEELYESSDFPMGEAYAVAYEYLHGARIALDQNLTRPTRLLVATAALNALHIAEREDQPASHEERTELEALVEGKMPTDAETLLGALTTLAVFVERRLTKKDA